MDKGRSDLMHDTGYLYHAKQWLSTPDSALCTLTCLLLVMYHAGMLCTALQCTMPNRWLCSSQQGRVLTANSTQAGFLFHQGVMVLVCPRLFQQLLGSKHGRMNDCYPLVFLAVRVQCRFIFVQTSVVCLLPGGGVSSYKA